MEQLTDRLNRFAAGHRFEWRDVATQVEGELKRIAAAHLARHRDRPLQPTELVHEAWLRLSRGAGPWQSRLHFYATAARLMRNVLVDLARSSQAAKRSAVEVPLDTDAVSAMPALDLLDLDAALDRLSQLSPRQAQIVELRYFVGLTVEETAATLGVSEKTVKRDWTVARAWLAAELAR
jgi:RNA polymerase sigma factor (TIGR02999 family)